VGLKRKIPFLGLLRVRKRYIVMGKSLREIVMREGSPQKAMAAAHKAMDDHFVTPEFKAYRKKHQERAKEGAEAERKAAGGYAWKSRMKWGRPSWDRN